MRRVDDDLVFQAAQVGQPADRRRVVASDAGGCREDQSRRRAGRDVSRLVVRKRGDSLAGPALKVVQLDEAAGRLRHRRQHLRRHDRPTKPRQRRRRVDQWRNAQFVIQAHRCRTGVAQ